MEKRTIALEKPKGLGISDVILVGVLLAAGAVLKLFVGSLFNAGMKPNFIIAMYCLAILLVRPRLGEAAVIGLLAGAVCQFFPGTPYLNLLSELLGAVAMALMCRVPMKLGRVNLAPMAAAFLSTLVSGFAFIGLMYLVFYAGADITPTPLAAFLAIIFGTAVVNTVIVEVLYLPLRQVVKRGEDR